MNFIDGDSGPDRLKNGEQPVIVLGGQPLPQRRAGQRRRVQGIQTGLRSADGLHQRFLKPLPDRHHLPGRLHLRAKAAGRSLKFVERPFRILDHHVIQRRLEAGAGFAGDIVDNFIQRIAQRDPGGDFGDGIAGCLAGQRGRTGYPRVDFDHRVLKGIRVERELAVAPADNPQCFNHPQGGGPQHLIFPVGKGQRRRDDNAVPGMNSNGVDIFHGTDSNRVSRRIPHGLELNFLPSGNTSFHQNLMDRRGIQACPGNPAQFILIASDSAAAASQRVGRTDNHRVADPPGSCQRSHQILRGFRRHARLADLPHGVPEALPVFGFFDGFHGRAQQSDAEFIQGSVSAQLHGQCQGGLSAEPGQQPVRPFLFDDPAKGHGVQWLQVDLIRQMLIRHDGRRIGVHQDDVDSLRFQHPACLGSGIVKFRCLADHNGAGSDHENLPDRVILRHGFPLPSSGESGQRDRPYPAAPDRPPDETAR